MMHRLMFVGILLVALVIGACGTSPEPFDYQNTNETKPGRGVFTGDDGAWTIYRKEMPPEEAAQSAESRETVNGSAASSDKEDAAPGRADSE